MLPYNTEKLEHALSVVKYLIFTQNRPKTQLLRKNVYSTSQAGKLRIVAVLHNTFFSSFPEQQKH